MPKCSNCQYSFRTLPDEELDHDCPKCGWHPAKKWREGYDIPTSAHEFINGLKKEMQEKEGGEE